MPQKTDLYTILISYANKHHSPVINIDHFVEFLEKFAKWNASDRPEWTKWTVGANAKIWSEIHELVNSGKCALETDGRNPGRVVMLDFYSDLLKRIYENVDSTAEIPFPDEKTLGIVIPREQIRTMQISDLEDYMKSPQQSDLPILEIKFPNDYGSALFLAAHFPMRVLEAAILKIRSYMRSHNNKDYYLSRLNSQLAGKGAMLKDFMNQIEVRPMECITHIEAAEEFICLVWPYFGTQIKLELEKKSELLSLDVAVLQSIFFIEFFVGYCRSRANLEKARDQALMEVVAKLSTPPYYHTIQDILAFTDSRGRLLANQYKQEDMEKLITGRTAITGGALMDEAGEDALPELLIFRNTSGEQVFIPKDKVFPVVSKFVEEARVQVRQSISTRWFQRLKDYQHEPAMDYDRDFERMLEKYAGQIVPMLMCFIKDKKIFLVQEELERAVGGFKESVRIYDPSGKVFPMSNLLLLNRKKLLADTKLLLPFWYTIPVIVSLMAFFKKLGRKKPAKKAKPGSAETLETPPFAENQSSGQTLKGVAKTYLDDHVPEGHTLETYLEEMESRWRKILSEDARAQMVKDIRLTIKKKMNAIIDAWGIRQITAHTIDDMADSIVQELPSLQDLDSKDAIHSYVSLYLSFLLKNSKK
ncbi:hypothetical protein AGMMS50267_05050 [Spirochaetia bacterium]|nr:hypothetical protein AGMMS50267_05050 [Spirochaetia bacterium]